jgi:small-conductance mechanosensitive channel
MKRSRFGIAAMVGGFVGEWACSAAAQSAYAADSAFLNVLTERMDFTIHQIPALGRHLWQLPTIVDGRTALWLLGIVVVGLVAETIGRLLLSRIRVRTIDRLVPHSPLGAFGAALALDIVALVALFIAGRVVLLRLGDTQSVGYLLGQQVFQALFYWRAFNLLFRAFLRPATPEGRIAPVDDATARSLLIALNWVVVLPLIASHLGRALLNTGAPKEVVSAAIILYAPVIAACLLWVVWHWHKEMATWLSAMVSERKVGRQLKLDAAHRWWMFGLAFYAAMGTAAVYAALTESSTAARGLAMIETTLLVLLLFETLMHRITRHIVSELPMAGDVVADCLRLIARLYAIILVADALMVKVLGAMTADEWVAHDRGAKIAAITLVAIYAFWRFLRFRMDSYIAANPLPSADAAADSEDDVKVAASRLRTLMPLLRAMAGSTILVVGGLLVLSELGVNITPLIAGASVFGLAVSFGSQSLVRDVVSGIFFLAEDAFRIGEYVDCSKVKGTVEGFSVRCLKLRHQNGQLHIVPFGQVMHITNFSRDWTVVKFNLAFAPGTDVELLRKTVKKIGTDMMEEPAFKPILMQPLKMQGVVDIKDSSLIVRFKFMARPKNPSAIQRMGVRRMYEQLPKVGIQFATPTMPFAFPGMMPMPTATTIMPSAAAPAAAAPAAAAPAATEAPPAPAKAAE